MSVSWGSREHSIGLGGGIGVPADSQRPNHPDLEHELGAVAGRPGASEVSTGNYPPPTPVDVQARNHEPGPGLLLIAVIALFDVFLWAVLILFLYKIWPLIHWRALWHR